MNTLKKFIVILAALAAAATASAQWVDDNPDCMNACSIYCAIGGYPNQTLCMDVCRYCECDGNSCPEGVR